MTSDPLPTPAARECLNCGRTARPGDRFCHFCFHSLQDAPAARPARAASRRAALLRIGLAAAILVAASIPVYRLYRAETAPLPLPSSTQRSADAANIARTRATELAAPLDAPIAWRQPLPARVAGPASSDGSRVYVPLVDARLAALSLEDGRTVWSIPAAGQPDHPPVVAGDLLYVGLRDGQLLALEPATGATRWAQDIGSWVREPPVVIEGVVYALGARTLTALDAENGDVLWAIELEGDALAGPAITSDAIAIATARRLFLYGRVTAEEIYWLTIPDLRSVATMHDAVFALSTRFVAAVEQDSRRPWWEPVRTIWFNLELMGLAPHIESPENRWIFRNEPDPPLHAGLRATWPEPYPIALDAARAYVSWPRGTFRAHDVQTGDVVWEREVGALTGPPLLTRDGLLLLQEGAIVLLDPATGSERERREFPGLSFRDAVIADDAMLLTTDDSVVLVRR